MRIGNFLVPFFWGVAGLKLRSRTERVVMVEMDARWDKWGSRGLNGGGVELGIDIVVENIYCPAISVVFRVLRSV